MNATSLSPPATTAASGTDLLLWVAIPYICLAVFVVGHIWRYRHDQFGWTTHTSQLLEHRWLRRGSQLFHLGAFMVIAGHVVGLAIPDSWAEAVGIREHAYHTRPSGRVRWRGSPWSPGSACCAPAGY